MRLDHEFTVPVPADEAWNVLLDIRRIAPCLPGAVIDGVTDDAFTGRVKVKVGPISVAYAGTGHFLEQDQAAGRVRIGASGKETRGSGTAKATITAHLHDEGSSTRVSVQTELNITGKPAQFGRGVMADVGNKLLGQFADCLAEQLAGAVVLSGASAAVAAGQADPASKDPVRQDPVARAPVRHAPVRDDPERRDVDRRDLVPTDPMPVDPVPIDLLGAAAMPVLKRVLPIGGVVAILVLLVAVRRRRR